jgi:thiol-disulfide isomerase/thioredoxin
MKTKIVISILLALVATFFIVRKMRAVPEEGTLDEFYRKTQLTDMEGIPLNKDALKGKVVIMSCFQTWCSDCAKEQPDLFRLKQKFGDQLEVIMVSDEPVSLMIKFRDKFRSPFNFYHSHVTLRPDMGVKHFPTTYLVSKTGEIEEAKVMATDWYSPETIAMIGQLLAR